MDEKTLDKFIGCLVEITQRGPWGGVKRIGKFYKLHKAKCEEKYGLIFYSSGVGDDDYAFQIFRENNLEKIVYVNTEGQLTSRAWDDELEIIFEKYKEEFFEGNGINSILQLVGWHHGDFKQRRGTQNTEPPNCHKNCQWCKEWSLLSGICTGHGEGYSDKCFKYVGVKT